MVTASVRARRQGIRLVAAVILERMAELVVSERHRRWALRSGGVQAGAGHYPALVVAHATLLAGCALRLLRVPGGGPPPIRSMTGLVAAAQGLRWWCVVVLGRQWNTRVVVIPGAARCRRGPYRWLAHPNYLAVAIEGVALPCAVGAYRLALAFTLVNAGLLAVRIQVENRALTLLSDPREGPSPGGPMSSQQPGNVAPVTVACQRPGR